MCRYCNTITMHHASEGQSSICVESVYGFLNGRPNLNHTGCEMGSSRFETGKVAETGRNNNTVIAEMTSRHVHCHSFKIQDARYFIQTL